MSKDFMMHCDHCGRKVMVKGQTGVDRLVQGTPLAPIPIGVPTHDPEGKDGERIIIKKPIPRRRMFKCSVCGRGLILKPSMIPPSEHVKKEDNNEEEDNSIGRERGVT
jgi:hypothetical protein